jgi:hypothetical protein
LGWKGADHQKRTRMRVRAQGKGPLTLDGGPEGKRLGVLLGELGGSMRTEREQRATELAVDPPFSILLCTLQVSRLTFFGGAFSLFVFKIRPLIVIFRSSTHDSACSALRD